MKKVLFLCIILFLPNMIIAECDYKTEKNMTSLSLYVNYNYNYNESTKLFDITVYNLQDIFILSYNSKIYYAEDNKVNISDISLGTEVSFSIIGSESCSGQTFRNIKFTTPFLNPYYGSEACKEYPDNSVCYSRFLNFNISRVTFENAIKREEKSEQEEVIDDTNYVLEFLKNNYIKIIIVLLTSTFWILRYKSKYRKSKHGF